MKLKNLTGSRFTHLEVIKLARMKEGGHSVWLCRCDCGVEKEVDRTHLVRGSTVSCGCYNKKRASDWLKKYANSSAHRGAGNPAYKRKATLGSAHLYLHRHFSHLKKNCSFCGSSTKRLDFAKKKGKPYTRNIKNYYFLCRSCHLRYDYTEERRAKQKSILKKALAIRWEKHATFT